MRLQPTLRSLPLSKIQVTDAFWSEWQRLIRDVSLPIQYDQCAKTGRFENFRRAARGEKGTFEGRFYNDSDVYKWIEAGSYLLMALGRDANTERMLDEVIEAIAAAQMPDGYINTYFQLEHPELRWRNLGFLHEMYCMGHLIEAAVAHAQATAKTTLLEVAIKAADHIMSVFGPGKRVGYCGHEELEIALLKLADQTGEDKYRDYAKWMVEARGSRPSPFEQEFSDPEAMKLSSYSDRLFLREGKYDGAYAQDHKPLREQSEVVGHAVRAMYLYSAAAEAFSGADDEGMEAALQRLWDNLTQRRMYVTGGIGPSAHNEGFTHDFDLPNRTAYAETCASCGLVFWARRLLEATGDASFADVLELALYNGALAGISKSGDRFFYVNPLESHGTHHRSEWFDCACCPPNIARLIASVGGQFVATSDEAIALVVPASFEATAQIKGVDVRITVEGSYPWSGEVKVTLHPEEPVEFELMVRTPGWCDDLSVETDLELPEPNIFDGFLGYRRTWKSGDALTLSYEMPPTWLEADPRIQENLGKVALRRGPLVYCLEEADFGASALAFQAEVEGVEDIQQHLEDGVVKLEVPGFAIRGDHAEAYEPVGTQHLEETTAKLVPYYFWDNRTPGSMAVWLRRS